MCEGRCHMDAVRPGAPVHIGSITLLPIERVVLRAALGSARVWISAAKEPYALIVRDAAGVWAIDRDAEPVTLEALREKVPELDAGLAAM